MRPQLIQLLACPSCRKDSLRLDENGTQIPEFPPEIREGRLTCQDCRRPFHIKDGIVDLLPDPSQELLGEAAGMARMYDPYLNDEHYDREILLRLPYKHKTNDPAHWMSVAKNFDQGVELIKGDLRKDGPAMTLLDLGAGSCWSTATFAKLGFQCIALDISVHRKAGLGAADIRMNNGAPFFDR